jgi:hypothetical protein
MKDLLKGGKSDKIPPDAFPKDKVRQGAKVESEHTTNKTLAKEIARDHLTEDIEYYTKLKKMEKKAMQTALLAGFTDELEKIAFLNNPYARGAIGGAIIGGATAGEGNRLSGAAMGAAGGAALVHGGKHLKRFHTAVKPHADAAGIKGMGDVGSSLMDSQKRKTLSEVGKKGLEDAKKLKLE